MKLNKILAAVAVSVVSVSALAQTPDLFNSTRTYVLAAPQNIVVSAANLVTNGPLDHAKLLGRVTVDFTTVTNTGNTGGTLTAQLFTSSDNTNWTALANYAIVNSTYTDNITNYWNYGSSNVVANTLLLPGTVTTPTGYSAGFVTPYLAPLQFTNSGAITLSGAGNKTVEVSFNVIDQPRYINVVYTPGGTVTNFTTAALLHGVNTQPF
jgi:hypothetical protein